MRVDYTVQIWREGAQFVAQAMPLDVVSAGRTPAQARAALDEAVGLFLTTAQEMGTLREVLEECAYEPDESGWRAPEWIAIERHSTQLSA
jgi:predicted RNase H-like HicB family nuclease